MKYDLSKIKTKTFSNNGPYALGEEVNEFIEKEIKPGCYEYIDLKLQFWNGCYRAMLVYAEMENKNDFNDF